jgi:hypothetical protein
MQQPFTYNPIELENVKGVISEERLGPYLAIAGSDLRQAIRLYERNTSLSEALYGLLQGFEISLRNSMHRALAGGFGREDWYDSVTWHRVQQQQIDSAKQSLQKKAKPVTPGGMVAELMLGFWVGLTGPKYSVDLWQKHLYKAFPNAKLGRKQVSQRIEHIRNHRNRVAHHESILLRDLPKDVNGILETLHWINSDAERWVRETNCFFERFSGGKEMRSTGPETVLTHV